MSKEAYQFHDEELGVNEMRKKQEAITVIHERG